MKLIKTFSH